MDAKVTPAANCSGETTAPQDAPFHLEICPDLSAAADSVLRHSFAVVRLDGRDAASLARAWSAARSYFARAAASSPAEFARRLERHRRVVGGGHLLGFTRPSAAKLLYRAVCTKWGRERGMPWPDDDEEDGGEMREASTEAAEGLHGVLTGILAEMRSRRPLVCERGNLRGREDKENAVRDGASCEEKRTFRRPSLKRRRLCGPEGIGTDSDAAMSCAPPPSMRDAGYCPLDYFLYHGGRAGAGARGHHCGSAPPPNCSEHVDRGALICVSLTDVLGLEVKPRGVSLPARQGEDGDFFVCPEVLSRDEALRRDRGSAGCGDLICVMAGDGLAEACGLGGGGVIGEEETTPRACVHRVRDELERARLSITYELRLQTSIN